MPLSAQPNIPTPTSKYANKTVFDCGNKYFFSVWNEFVRGSIASRCSTRALLLADLRFQRRIPNRSSANVHRDSWSHLRHGKRRSNHSTSSIQHPGVEGSVYKPFRVMYKAVKSLYRRYNGRTTLVQKFCYYRNIRLFLVS